jgi:hypothetical protein
MTITSRAAVAAAALAAATSSGAALAANATGPFSGQTSFGRSGVGFTVSGSTVSKVRFPVKWAQSGCPSGTYTLSEKGQLKPNGSFKLAHTFKGKTITFAGTISGSSAKGTVKGAGSARRSGSSHSQVKCTTSFTWTAAAKTPAGP